MRGLLLGRFDAKCLVWLGVLVAAVCAPKFVGAEPAPGEGPNLGARVRQHDAEVRLSLSQLISEGRRIFSTPFNHYDGLGDGPMDPADPASPGGRPTLGGNGTVLRMNGLDSQTCLECHNVGSTLEIPARFSVGGAGGIGATAFPGVVAPDIADSQRDGLAAIRGRVINPPFVFGAGGVELLAKEMTQDLQELRRRAEATPGELVQLVTKGVHFGSIVFEDGVLDLSGVEGIDDDLVVRPFGRKGCCATVRDFDIGALQFHHGIQPVEVVGEGVDADGDGVVDEMLVGELSALHAFQTSLRRPTRVITAASRNATRAGRRQFARIGCTECHVPSLRTRSRFLTLSFPELETDPAANVWRRIDLGRPPARFRRVNGGVEVELFADLKRHYMGEGLRETTGSPLDAYFTTARLWGVADTAPYLHDGRATSLTQAILEHGGEAQLARDAFEALGDTERLELLTFLRSLRTPRVR